MSLSGKALYGFGIEPLLELPWDDPEDVWDLVERVRMRGTVETDTEGSVLATDSAYNNNRMWHNPGWGNSHAHKVTYEEWLNSDRRTPKEKARDELIAHLQDLKRTKDLNNQERAAYWRSLEQSNTGLRSWAARQAGQTPEQREVSYTKQVENARRKVQERKIDEELARKVDEEEERAREHERQRQWALHTSAVEKRIVEIVDAVDANAKDRALMRAMLRYMNLGPGQGQQWDVDTFARFHCASSRGGVIDMVKLDVERCYQLLRCR